MAICVGDWADFAIISGLLAFNGVLGFWEEHQAAGALEALKNSLALNARVKRAGKWCETLASELVPGDIIRLYLGDVAPADCTLIEGDYLNIDQAALTGESLPVSKTVGDPAYSGSIVKQGEMVAVVTATGGETFFGRTAKLVASAGSTSHFQQAVLRIGNFLIVLAVAMAAILVVDGLYHAGARVGETSLLKLAEIVLILLVASVPVAMPAVREAATGAGATAAATVVVATAKAPRAAAATVAAAKAVAAEEQANIATAKAILKAVAPKLPDASKSPATNAMEHAIMTARDRISDDARTKLKPLVGRYLD